MSKTTIHKDLVRFHSGLEEHVLEALIKERGWWNAGDICHEDCEYCTSIMDGEGPSEEACEHWRHFLGMVYPAINEIEDSLTEEERDLLRQASSLKFSFMDGAAWKGLPEGYYAVPDPRANVEEMTYWRRKDKGKNKRPSFGPWPLKACYGPAPYKRDIPANLGELPEKEYVRAFFEVVARPYREAIVEAIVEEPVAAGQRLADFAMRCCMCGKALTNELSKVYGIGPECRKGMPAEVLANYYRPRVGRAHATAEAT